MSRRIEARSKRKRKVSVRRELLIARSQLAAIERVFSRWVAGPIKTLPTGPAPFVQCWSVTRGYASVTQALDRDGQVWERVTEIKKDDVTGQKTAGESWWFPISMERRGA